MPKYYELSERNTEHDGLQIKTAALITCGLCGEMIDGMGGPGNGAICSRCGDELKRGNLRGAVVWSDE